VLDLLDADPELEDGGDDELTGDEEPTLGAGTGMQQGHAWNVRTDESGEDEPSLGWCGVGQGCPGLALPGYADDRELVNEDGGGDDNGIGDMDGAYEQWPFLAGAGRVE
jgi:hypothetical protein